MDFLTHIQVYAWLSLASEVDEMTLSWLHVLHLTYKFQENSKIIGKIVQLAVAYRERPQPILTVDKLQKGLMYIYIW